MYFNSNMFAPLPVPLAWDGAADTLLTLNVADDLAGEAAHVATVDVRVLLSDPSGLARCRQASVWTRWRSRKSGTPTAA